MKWFVLLFLTGCGISSSDRELLNRDRANKELEIMYLKEIKIAQENNDRDSFKYFFGEYMKVDRINIPDHLKKHPDYFEGGINRKY